MVINHTEVNNDILELARKTLSQQQIETVERIVQHLIKKGHQRKLAIAELVRYIGIHPLRPLFYLNSMHLMYLPRYTRDCMRYLGDYVDLLLKACIFDKTKNPKQKRAPFGANVNASRGVLDAELTTHLEEFNKSIYQPAKHDFSPLQPGRKHRFTAGEVAYSVFISKNIGIKLVNASELTRRVAEDKDQEFWCENMTGSSYS